MSAIPSVRPFLRSLTLITVSTLGLLTVSNAQTAREQAIINDQHPTPFVHEAKPRNAPDAFKNAPRLTRAGGFGGDKQLNPWGQIYEIAGTDNRPDAENTRVQIRNLCLFELVKFNNGGFQWYLTRKLNGSAITGAAFTNGFTEGAGNGPAFPQADSKLIDGVRSVRVGRNAFYNAPGRDSGLNNTNYHFYPSASRRVYNENPIDGVFVTCEVRLIKDGPIDDRANARYTAGVGADYRNISGVYIGDTSIGNHRRVTNNWKTIRSINLSKSDIIAFTPPNDR
jgi:hypothetical protein